MDKRRKKKQKEQAEDEAFLDNEQDDGEYEQGNSDGEPEPEYNEDARRKLAATGLTSDEEDEGAAGASGYDTDSNQADAPQAGSQRPHGEDAELAAAEAVKGGKKKQKASRSRSKSRERDSKGTPRLKKRPREPGQLHMHHFVLHCPALCWPVGSLPSVRYSS